MALRATQVIAGVASTEVPVCRGARVLALDVVAKTRDVIVNLADSRFTVFAGQNLSVSFGAGQSAPHAPGSFFCQCAGGDGILTVFYEGCEKDGAYPA